MNEWHDLFVATAGASAALTGLIFVGVSINLETILSFAHLPGRALISLSFLSTILVISVMLLVPGQSYTIMGIEILLAGILSMVVILKTGLNILRKIGREFKKAGYFNLIFDQATVSFYFIGAIYLFSGNNGLYWVIFAFTLSFIKSITDAWVLLIEIKR